MARELTGDALAKLLECFDPDPERAGEMYEDERRKLLRHFERKGARSPEELADITLDRAAHKLAEGEKIKNIGGYCHEIARLVLKEHWKPTHNVIYPGEEIDPNILVADNSAEDEDYDLMFDCLEDCLKQLGSKDQLLLLEFYEPDGSERIIKRKKQAERLGIKREALGNRAQRLRDKLEQCIKDCCDPSH